MKLSAVFVLTVNIIASCPRVSALTCADLFGEFIILPRTDIFIHPDTNEFIHRVRSSRVDQWINDIVPSFSSREEMQKKWPANSMEGQIWTVKKGENAYEDYGPVTVEITTDQRFGFYDPTNLYHTKLWNEWKSNGGDGPDQELSGNTSKPNRFSEEQKERLREEKLPYHSGFYDQFYLVGINDSFNSHIFTLVNFDGVISIKVILPSEMNSLQGFTSNIKDFLF